MRRRPKAAVGIEQERCDVTNSVPGGDPDYIMHQYDQRVWCRSCGYTWVIPHHWYGQDRTHGVLWYDNVTDGASKSINIPEICEGGKWIGVVVCTSTKFPVQNTLGFPDFLQNNTERSRVTRVRAEYIWCVCGPQDGEQQAYDDSIAIGWFEYLVSGQEVSDMDHQMD